MIHKSLSLATKVSLLLGIVLSLWLSVSAQNATASSDNLSQAEIDRIVNTLTAKEAQFRNALNVYSFKRDAMLQTLGMGGQITGEYHRVSTFTFDDQGNRYEKISFFPMPSYGETKINKFPTVETYREQIDGKYWFPTYSYADEELIFDNGEPLHIRMKVRYTDFAPARADVKVIEVDGSELPNQQVKPSPAKPKP